MARKGRAATKGHTQWAAQYGNATYAPAGAHYVHEWRPQVPRAPAARGPTGMSEEQELAWAMKRSQGSVDEEKAMRSAMMVSAEDEAMRRIMAETAAEDAQLQAALAVSAATAHAPPAPAAAGPSAAGSSSAGHGLVRSRDKQRLGEQLFPLVLSVQPELAGKITGMLLDMEIAQLHRLVDSAEALDAKITEAVSVLQMRTEAAAPVTRDIGCTAEPTFDEAVDAGYAAARQPPAECETGQQELAAMEAAAEEPADGLGADAAEEADEAELVEAVLDPGVAVSLTVTDMPAYLPTPPPAHLATSWPKFDATADEWEVI